MNPRLIPDALEWKFGAVADTAGAAITAWRHPTLPQPTEAELAALLAEYDAHLAALAVTQEADAVVRRDRRARFTNTFTEMRARLDEIVALGNGMTSNQQVRAVLDLARFQIRANEAIMAEIEEP